MTAVHLFARGGAAAYAAFRPTYPAPLVQRIVRDCTAHSVAVDIGCGTGQLTAQLAASVGRAIGVDVSAEQVAQAAAASPDNCEFVVGSAHTLPVDGVSVADVATIAQTMHWLDPALTFAECRRVLKPGGLLAVVGYPICSVVSSDAANKAVKKYHFETLRQFWHPGRWLLDDGYRFFDLSEHGFEQCESLAFDDTREMSLDAFISYMATQSARKTMIDETGEDPLPRLREELTAAIGSAEKLQVQFPFIAKLGVNKQKD